ncbi:MAG: sugar transferase [Candidatus Dadabacteria bacterium]|nr:MAG: sugar transferase [Candidatus Dadabacteria bacterium]
MLKENWRLISRLERLGDVLIIVLSFFLAYYGRNSMVVWNRVLGWNLPFQDGGLAPIQDYSLVLVVSLISYMVVLQAVGAYTSMRFSSSIRLFGISLFSSAVVFFVLAAVLFLLKLDLSRSFIALFCLLVGLFLAGERYLVMALLRYWRRRGRNFRNIILCGTGKQAIRFASEIASMPELGIRIRAFADLKGGDDYAARRVQFTRLLKERGIKSIGKILDGPEEVERALREYAIDEVVFTDVVEVMPQVESLIVICSEQGVRTTITADLFSLGMVKSGISYFGNIPLIHFQTPPGDRWELAVKRLIDIVVSAALLILLLPVFLLIAIAIKLTSPGPVFFVQKRMGLNGRIFSMYKFRSMYVGADKEQEKLKEQNEMKGPVFKLSRDPRVTRIGRFLRRFSLDELPQLWNVLRGDMSLVGPRPPIPGEVSLYERRDRRRLSMRPGMTCIWQVSGRNEISDFESWVKLDLEYIDNWSLAQDFKLLLKTIPAVISGTGAR